MDKTEQKMFESIKELISSDLNVERIEGFEPHWWGNDNQDEAEAQPVQHNDSRSRRDDRNKRNEYANKSDKNSKKQKRKTIRVLSAAKLPAEHAAAVTSVSLAPCSNLVLA